MIAAFAAAALAATPTTTTSSCDELAARYHDEARTRPDAQPRLWWVLDNPPCAPGTHLGGASPPDGNDLWCEDNKGRKSGIRTTFDPNGHVRSESLWERDHEVGPRLEWDTSRNVVARVWSFDERGLLDGETVEWSEDGSMTVTTWLRGNKHGITWRLDDHHQLVLAEQWQAGERSGHSCTWRDGRLDVDQVWLAGDPTPSNGS